MSTPIPVVSAVDLARRFGISDYVVFAGMLTVSAAIGIYYACSGSKQSTTNEFLMGDRSMSVFPVSVSVLASFLSAITLLGTPVEVYQHGTQYWMICMSYFIVMPLTAYCYLPVFHTLGVTSVYEYLEKRFSLTLRIIGSALFIVEMVIYLAVVLYTPSLALYQVTGINIWVCILSTGAVCIFYTTVGGIKAVVWTDFFQVTLMVVSLLVIVFKGAYHEGGFDKVWKINLEGKRIEFLNTDFDPTVRHTVWNLIFGGSFLLLTRFGVNQILVQRYLTTHSLKAAQLTIWLNLPGGIFVITASCLAGLIIYSKYHECDPITAGLVSAPDQLLPLFVMDVLRFLPGLPGLFVSGVYSAALSTLSSGINSLAAVTLEDIVKTCVIKEISELWATRITKGLTLLYGIITILLVAVVELLGEVLQATWSFHGILGGPLLGLFTLGMFCPWANSKGALCGLLFGLVLSSWIGFGAIVYKPDIPMPPVSIDGCLTNVTLSPTLDPRHNENILTIYRLSYMWFTLISVFFVLFSGIIISLLTGKSDPGYLDPQVISPVFGKFCQWLPPSVLSKLDLPVGNKMVLLSNDSTENTKNQRDP
ncbi:sodium-coupled monocarboxylate transporter 2-like [Tachypleus tridentatus]|uniref:sodium-coupled monocarboxylate transporter 2-like n=1 Tax=Tachypleus tridentatus TaxID=6853 RepID=UPI003FD5FBF8